MQDDDIPNFQSKILFEDEDDLPPVLSLCFKQIFNETKLKDYRLYISNPLYLAFLMGAYFDKNMAKIKYGDVSMDISEYVRSYMVNWLNGSLSQVTWDKNKWIWKNPWQARGITETAHNYYWRSPYVTYSGFLYPNMHGLLFWY